MTLDETFRLAEALSREHFQKAWDKFLLFRKSPSLENELLTNLTKITEHNFTKKLHKNRLIVHTLQAIYFLDIDNITFFETAENTGFALDTIGKTFFTERNNFKRNRRRD